MIREFICPFCQTRNAEGNECCTRCGLSLSTDSVQRRGLASLRKEVTRAIPCEDAIREFHALVGVEGAK